VIRRNGLGSIVIGMDSAIDMNVCGHRKWHRFLIAVCMIGVLISFNEVRAGETDHWKEETIRGILSDLQLMYYANPKYRGKTFEVVIKDFKPGEKETYVIIDQLKRFFVMNLQDEKEKYKLCGFACSQDFPLGKVKKNLVTDTRTNGLSRQFRIPIKQEDLPH